MNHDYNYRSYHSHCPPSLFARIWILNRRSKRVIEDEHRGFKTEAMCAPVRFVLT